MSIPFVARFLDEDGKVRANDIMEKAATAMLEALQHWVAALKTLRAHSAKPA